MALQIGSGTIFVTPRNGFSPVRTELLFCSDIIWSWLFTWAYHVSTIYMNQCGFPPQAFLNANTARIPARRCHMELSCHRAVTRLPATYTALLSATVTALLLAMHYIWASQVRTASVFSRIGIVYRKDYQRRR